MPRQGASGTKGLFKRHHCEKRPADPTRCDCQWRGKRGRHEVVLGTWARDTIDPRVKGPAVTVFNRFRTAVDTNRFDPAGEHPALGATDQTLSALISEYTTHYVNEYGLSANSLGDMLNVVATSSLGGRSLEHLATNRREVADWLNATGKARRWSSKTWNEYRGLLFRVFKQGIEWDRLTINPAEKIKTRVFSQPDHFRQRHLEEDIEDRLFAVVGQLNRIMNPPTHRKLTQEKADAIRAALAAGQTGKAVAAQYGISPAIVSSVKMGDIWNPAHARMGTLGTEMERRLIAAFDGGLRAGEMLRIQLQHVNWRPVFFQPAEGPRIEGYEIALPPEITKGGKSTGEIEYLYATSARFRMVLESRRFALRNKPVDQQFIFGAEDGHQQKSFDRQWRELFRLAGLKYGRKIGVVWHTIRHEFISRLAEMTKDPVLTQKLARHRQLETTQLYFHTRRDRELAAMAGLERRS